MEENVALDTTKQRKFVKSIKGIKKLIKKHDTEPTEEVQTPKIKTPKPKSRKKPDRGLVYLSHIPHGFYEHEMSQYFKQFGVVTNVRVIRSKRTGNSKGFAFVEFREPAVAEIVAETMNNYLMGKRLIKAAYVPPEKQRPKALRKHWSRLNNPGIDARLKYKKSYNENKDEQGELKRATKILSKLNKTKKELSGLGINYDFFTPVDVPEGLQDSLKTDDTKEIKDVVKDEKKQKKSIKEQTVVNDTNISVKKTKKNKEKENEKNIKPQKDDLKKEVVAKNEKKQTNIKKEKKINKEVEPVINKKEQKKKQQKLTDAGMDPPEKFIKVTEDSEDSDSSFEFDSDEYEKMLENEGSDDDSTEYSDNDEDESEEIESEEENVKEILPPVKKNKAKPVPVIAQPPKQNNKQKRKAPALVEKCAPKKPPVAPKKAKFEKQTQKSMKKQFKKKK